MIQRALDSGSLPWSKYEITNEQLRLFTYPRKLEYWNIWQSVLWTGVLVQWKGRR